VDKDFVEGTPKKMHVKAIAEDVGLDLFLVPSKPAVLNGERGYSRKSEASPLIASRYFSFTDLKTGGTMKLGSSVFPVQGKSWFDREISSRGCRRTKRDGTGSPSSSRTAGRSCFMTYEKRRLHRSLLLGDPCAKDGRYRRLSKRILR
jgi:predicted secreted hydrolase